MLFVLLSLFPAGTIFSQHAVKNEVHPSTGICLSLWKNLSTQRNDTTRNTCVNLGAFSSLNRLNGIGVNVVGTVVRKDVNGVQVSGISNMASGCVRGVQVAGITNVVGDNFTGLSVSGLVGISGGEMRGVYASGLANVYDSGRGVVLGGLLNFGGKNASGLQLAGLCNVVGEEFGGLVISGMLAVSGKNLHGVQLAGIGSITGGDVSGLQVAGLGNVTGGMCKGVQLAPVNMAFRAKGLQIGLFNYYKEHLDGFQLGLVNANPQTRVQLMLFGGTATKLNVGARFKNRLFYTILGGGSHYLDFGNKFSASLFYRAGLELPLYKRLFISGDLGYQHIETFKNKDYGIPARLYALQARLNLEYRYTDRFGLFVTGGYGGSHSYARNRFFDKGLILEGGVVLF